MIKIEDIKGYVVGYDSRRKCFLLVDAEGAEVATAGTQQEIEEKAKVLAKQAFTRIDFMQINDHGVIMEGTVTSVDRDDRSMWVVMKGSRFLGRVHRNRVDLLISSYHYYENTSANVAVAAKIREQAELVDRAYVEVKRLRDTLEKKIDHEYFGMTSRL